MKLTRAERQTNNVDYHRNKRIFEKPAVDRIRMRLLAKTAEQNLEDVRFRYGAERGEIVTVLSAKKMPRIDAESFRMLSG